jgi:hypothetical protein
VPRQTSIRLAERVPLLPGADEVVFVDLDSTHRQVYGYANKSLSLRPFEPKGQKQPNFKSGASGWGSPVRAASAAATSGRWART